MQFCPRVGYKVPESNAMTFFSFQLCSQVKPFCHFVILSIRKMYGCHSHGVNRNLSGYTSHRKNLVCEVFLEYNLPHASQFGWLSTLGYAF